MMICGLPRSKMKFYAQTGMNYDKLYPTTRRVIPGLPLPLLKRSLNWVETLQLFWYGFLGPSKACRSLQDVREDQGEFPEWGQAL